MGLDVSIPVPGEWHTTHSPPSRSMMVCRAALSSGAAESSPPTRGVGHLDAKDLLDILRFRSKSEGRAYLEGRTARSTRIC